MKNFLHFSLRLSRRVKNDTTVEVIRQTINQNTNAGMKLRFSARMRCRASTIVYRPKYRMTPMGR